MIRMVQVALLLSFVVGLRACGDLVIHVSEMTGWGIERGVGLPYYHGGEMGF